MESTEAGAGQEAGRFKASDILRLAGLTYRQLHDWEQRAGILAPERATEEGWRRFTGEEVLALAICASLRRQLGVPLKRIGPLYLWLAGRRPGKVDSLVADIAEMRLAEMEANERTAPLLKLTGQTLDDALKDDTVRAFFHEFLRYKLNTDARRPVLSAVRLASLGLQAYLCTTFEISIVLTERSLVSWVAMRGASHPTVVFPLNELIRDLFAKESATSFEMDRLVPSFMDCWRELQARVDVSMSEREVLKAIRERAYQRVTAHVEDGQVVQVDVHEEVAPGPDPVREQAIIDLIKAKRYQTIELVVKDGNVVRLSRKVTNKVTSRHGKNPTRR